MTPKQKHRWLVGATAEYLKYLDGCFVECGVKQGTSSRIMAEILQREGYLFDTWTGFPHYSEYDLPSPKRKSRLDRRVSSKKSVYKDCKRHLKKFGVFGLCTMIKGDICKTVPDFIKDKTLTVDMMHIDTDLHDPAQVSIDNFAPFISNTGVILVHDYGDSKWPGIKKVVESFANEQGWFLVDHNDTIGVKVAALTRIHPMEYQRYICDKFERERS
jgi:hypothetical protein